MRVFSPVTETSRGFATFLKGFRWLRERPKYLGLLFIPMVLGLLFLVGGISFFISYDESVLGWILFDKPESWWGIGLYWISYVLVYVSMVVAFMVGSMLVMNIFASPFYEMVSIAVERDFTGQPEPHLDFFGNLKVMVVEAKKVGLILLLQLVMLFIPVLNILSTLLSAFLIGWDFFDYPVARRGWTLTERLRLVGSEFWSVLGFGLWLVIPIVQIFLMPLAVAGGTLLNLEALQKQSRLGPDPDFKSVKAGTTI